MKGVALTGSTSMCAAADLVTNEVDRIQLPAARPASSLALRTRLRAITCVTRASHLHPDKTPNQALHNNF